MQYEVAKDGTIYEIPAKEIYVDYGKNCRDEFGLVTVEPLAESIRETGLIESLILQPAEDVGIEIEGIKFKLIAGHRRFMAMTEILKWEKVSCRIITGLTEEQAYELNLQENIDREQLNIMEEAKALARWEGLSVTELGEKFKRGMSWVNARRQLLKLPEFVQKAAASGRLNQAHITVLSKFRYKSTQYIREKMEQLLDGKGVRGKKLKTSRTSRSKTDMVEIMAHIMECGDDTALSERELGFVLSTLAWCGNEIKTREFLVDRLEFPAHCGTVKTVK